jgi:hypothetical protein
VRLEAWVKDEPTDESADPHGKQDVMDNDDCNFFQYYDRFDRPP